MGERLHCMGGGGDGEGRVMMMVLSLCAGKVLVRMAMMTDKHPP